MTDWQSTRPDRTRRPLQTGNPDLKINNQLRGGSRLSCMCGRYIACRGGDAHQAIWLEPPVTSVDIALQGGTGVARQCSRSVMSLFEHVANDPRRP